MPTADFHTLLPITFNVGNMHLLPMHLTSLVQFPALPLMEELMSFQWQLARVATMACSFQNSNINGSSIIGGSDWASNSDDIGSSTIGGSDGISNSDDIGSSIIGETDEISNDNWHVWSPWYTISNDPGSLQSCWTCFFARHPYKWLWVHL